MVRAVGRLRWLFPAFAVPLCIVAVGAAVQAAAFRRPAPERMAVAQALRELLRYRVMRGIEQIGSRSVASTCLDGWFRVPKRPRAVRAALVVLGNGEHLYDLGKGIRRTGQAGPVGALDAARFELAACPFFLGRRLTTSLIYELPLDADPVRMVGVQNVLISTDPNVGPIQLLVGARSFRPIAVTISGRIRGSGRLEPGGSQTTVAHVLQAFHLARTRKKA